MRDYIQMANDDKDKLIGAARAIGTVIAKVSSALHIVERPDPIPVPPPALKPAAKKRSPPKRVAAKKAAARKPASKKTATKRRD